MAWLKRIGITLCLIVIASLIAYFGLKKYTETYSFAPDDPEQIQLAAEHALCAGYYRVMRSSLKKERPDYAELERQYTQEFEHHIKMGLNFSPDKELFKAQIEKASSQFGDEVINAAKSKTVSELVDKRMHQCFDTVFRGGAFVKRKLEERSR
ncbi:MAG TPA: hypothetical protein VK165_16715 [Azonexus sp.]|nr:hypothetical protein [Azonexus sp.]